MVDVPTAKTSSANDSNGTSSNNNDTHMNGDSNAPAATNNNATTNGNNAANGNANSNVNAAQADINLLNDFVQDNEQKVNDIRNEHIEDEDDVGYDRADAGSTTALSCMSTAARR